MLTLKLKIKECSDKDLLSDFIYHYTGLFYKIYNNPELMMDKFFIESQLNEYIDKSIYDSCCIDVKTKLNQLENSKNKNLKKIVEIEKELLNNNFKSKKEKRRKYRLIKKLAELKRNIDNNIVFGGKALLRNITKLSQTKSNDKLLNELKIEYKNKRRLRLYLIGRACEKGNRKIDFNLNHNEIMFKPNKNIKINIKFHSGNKQNKILNKLQQYSDLKLIPLTIKINDDYVYITYDEQLLNGYSFNEIECKKEQNKYKDKDIKKEIYIKWKNEQEDRMLYDKIKDRVISVDLNPKYIGISILQKSNENFNIIFTEAIVLSKLSIKLKLSSSDKKQVYQNNKRRYEICEVWKYIFNLAKHYKCSSFVMEDLNFKSNVINDNGKEFNRQTKNIWHRTLTLQLIEKYCNENGIKKIEVNPIYTSFIGNMIYEYFDPISASIEIGRRGIFKYQKGFSIYPEITRINQEKLNYLLGENIEIEGLSWKQLYAKISLLRYRNPKEGKIVKNLKTNKSKIKLLI